MFAGQKNRGQPAYIIIICLVIQYGRLYASAGRPGFFEQNVCVIQISSRLYISRLFEDSATYRPVPDNWCVLANIQQSWDFLPKKLQ